jgi:hypothetical protein
MLVEWDSWGEIWTLFLMLLEVILLYLVLLSTLTLFCKLN